MLRWAVGCALCVAVIVAWTEGGARAQCDSTTQWDDCGVCVSSEGWLQSEEECIALLPIPASMDAVLSGDGRRLVASSVSVEGTVTVRGSGAAGGVGGEEEGCVLEVWITNGAQVVVGDGGVLLVEGAVRIIVEMGVYEGGRAMLGLSIRDSVCVCDASGS